MTEDRSGWRPFIERACQAVGVDADLIDEDIALELAARVAREGERPMAPVATFILGLAVGSGKGDVHDLKAKIESVA